MDLLIREEVCAVVERFQVKWLALKHFGGEMIAQANAETRL
jgi:hypothetical protein